MLKCLNQNQAEKILTVSLLSGDVIEIQPPWHNADIMRIISENELVATPHFKLSPMYDDDDESLDDDDNQNPLLFNDSNLARNHLLFRNKEPDMFLVFDDLDK